MTRPTTSGLPFLIQRSDSGKFAYWRILADKLAPLVNGTIDLPWALESHTLKGKRAIKISLQTGDLTLAQRRWADIHPQIEVKIEVAIASAKKPVRPAVNPTPTLSSGDRATIAAQARHDVMADHDADWTDPENLGALARGLQQALRRRDAGELPPKGDCTEGGQSVLLSMADFAEFLAPFAPGISLNEIREVARAKEAENVARMLATGETWPLDCPTTVTEIIELDAKSPSGGRIVDQYETPSELTSRLMENGYDISDEKERRKVAYDVLTAKAAAYQDIDHRKKGAAIETPPRPAPLAIDNEDEIFPTILEMHENWAALVKPERKTKDDNKLYVERFVSQHGNLPVNQIKRKHIRDFRDQLKKFPANMPDAISKKPFLEIIEWAEKHDPQRLSPVTVNAKGLGTLSTLLQLAVTEYDLPGDPSASLRLPISEDDILERHPFTPALLAKLPLSPVFQHSPKVQKAGCGSAAFWIPLIGLYGGARLEEIGQLRLSDVLCESGITYFWFRDTDDEDGKKKTGTRDRRRGKAKNEEEKSIKTKAGLRRVPLHHVLIELGLLEYIAARRTAGDKMLFPQLQSYRGRWTKNWSRWWARYQDNHITNDPAFVFHSFRHSFIGAMRRKKIRMDFLKALVGHARELDIDIEDTNDITEQYGEAIPISLLNDEVQKVDYPGLIFNRIERFLR